MILNVEVLVLSIILNGIFSSEIITNIKVGENMILNVEVFILRK